MGTEEIYWRPVREAPEMKESNIHALVGGVGGENHGSNRPPETRMHVWTLAGPTTRLLILMCVQYFLLLQTGFSQLTAFISTLPALLPKKEDTPSKFQFEEHQGNTLTDQLGVMCPPWANSCDQAGGGLWMAHLNGMPISLRPGRQAAREGWQHHLDPCPEQRRGHPLKNESAVQWRAGEY